MPPDVGLQRAPVGDCLASAIGWPRLDRCAVGHRSRTSWVGLWGQSPCFPRNPNNAKRLSRTRAR